MNAETRKKLGAFYTDKIVASFLLGWAVRASTDKILDPSCGDGIFLNVADEHLRSRNGRIHHNIFGIDIQTPPPGIPIPAGNLIQSDFFKVHPSYLPQMDVVAGNPPFIRYQTFKGETRQNALHISNELGVKLSNLASSWAPFIIHASQFLKLGGRLAIVIPVEINHAAYALPVLQYLLDKFHSITFIAFRNKIFSDLNQDTFLLLGDGYGAKCSQLSLIVADSAESLRELDLYSGIPIDINSVREGKTRLLEYLLPDQVRRLFHSILERQLARQFGEVGDVGIGYVTGANNFFHLSSAEAGFYEIPKEFLKPALRSSGQLQGLAFTKNDWKTSDKFGEKVWLLAIPPSHDQLPESVLNYLETGMKEGVHKAYKTRIRKPWYSVPHIYVGDAFLSYMSGSSPKLVANAAKAIASNTLHVVKIKGDQNTDAHALAASWHTGFTLMSCEIEGHALGGGMLKLEPTEAENVSVLFADKLLSKEEIENLDRILRNEKLDAALDYTDRNLLMKIGLTKNDCLLLRDGYDTLRSWRMR